MEFTPLLIATLSSPPSREEKYGNDYSWPLSKKEPLASCRRG